MAICYNSTIPFKHNGSTINLLPNNTFINILRRLSTMIINHPSNGIFWLINDILVSYPFGSLDDEAAIAKSGNTYNHKLLWNALNSIGTSKPYNYYPRGRVVITTKGKAIIYMSPHIDVSYIDEIKLAFGLTTEPKLIYDNSVHYKCYLDNY